MHLILCSHLDSFDLIPVSLAPVLNWILFQVMVLAFVIVAPMLLALYHYCPYSIAPLHYCQSHYLDQAAVQIAVSTMVLFHQILKVVMSKHSKIVNGRHTNSIVAKMVKIKYEPDAAIDSNDEREDRDDGSGEP